MKKYLLLLGLLALAAMTSGCAETVLVGGGIAYRNQRQEEAEHQKEICGEKNNACIQTANAAWGDGKHQPELNATYEACRDSFEACCKEVPDRLETIGNVGRNAVNFFIKDEYDQYVSYSKKRNEQPATREEFERWWKALDEPTKAYWEKTFKQ